MKVIRPQTPSGYTVFCDEVRFEDNGKHLYLGVYVGEMIVYADGPTFLPVFTAAVTYRERPGESTDPVTFKMFIPGYDEPSQLQIPIEQFRTVQAETAIEDPLLTINVFFKVSPFEAREEGMIKVRAYRGDEEIQLGAIRLIFRKPPEVKTSK